MYQAVESSILTDEERTTAIGLARFAFEYIEAARLVDSNHRDRRPRSLISPMPAYFLAHHGLELTFKSYLRHKGVTVRELGSKRYGHDLDACYRGAKRLGLLAIFIEHQADVGAMQMLVDMNHDHGLRYIKTGSRQFPHWSAIESVAVRLHQAVAPVVGYKTFTSVV